MDHDAGGAAGTRQRPRLIDFYFDFSSPYGYLSSERIERIAARHGCVLRWHPILLGVVFKRTGGAPLPSQPLKGDYALHDFARTARLHGIEYRMPTRFPVSGVPPSRAFLWVANRDADAAVALAKALYRAYFIDDVDIGSVEGTVQVARSVGVECEPLERGMESAEVKAQLKAEVDAAMVAGVFGSPFFLVDGEPFWGDDRVEQVDRWLATGGW